jgi:hypothetical protein
MAARQGIPQALRQAVWLHYCGTAFKAKCHVSWCKSVLTPFIFEVGHDIPRSKGGLTTLDNLRPICAQCNKSMGNRYTIQQFSRTFMGPKKKGKWSCLGACGGGGMGDNAVHATATAAATDGDASPCASNTSHTHTDADADV